MFVYMLVWLKILAPVSSPPWRDVIVISYCRFNIKDAGAIKFSPCKPGLGQGFCGEKINKRRFKWLRQKSR